MIVLPIVGRELRVAARRAMTYRTRVLAALGAMVLATWKCANFAFEGGTASSLGRSLFYTLSTLAFAYCLLIGARVTSDSVSEEKREGTLGLLFLTDLKGWDVALGKLVASSLNSIYGLLAVLPLLAMPLLLGGVTLVQFGRMVVVLLNALFFSISVGIFVSTVSRNERRAMFGTILAILAPALVPACIVFFMVTIMEWVQTAEEFAELLPWLMVNPIYPFLLSLPSPGLPIMIPPWSFWVSIAAIHLVGWGLLFLTGLLLPIVWKERARVAPPAERSSWLARWRRWVKGDTHERATLRTRLLGRNPFLWLVSRDRFKPGYAWLFLLSMIAVWSWGYYQHREVMFDFYPLAPTIMLVHCFLKIWVVSEVSHRLVEDQRNGALELLLSTPLTIDEILLGQRMALVRQFGKPVVVLCAIELAVFQSSYPIRVIVPVQLMLIADLFTLMWVGMRLSLTARSINEVLLKSIFWVLVLPWVLFSALWPAWSWFGRAYLWNHWEPGFRHRVYFWLLVGLLTNAVLVLCWARPQLLQQFRNGRFIRSTVSWEFVQRWLAWRLKTEA